MLSRMKISIIICSFSAIFIEYSNSEAIEYSGRFQNVSISSETESISLTNLTIFRNYTHHRVSVVFKVTKDMNIKKIHVVINRCVYEKSACENFQEWDFPGNLLQSTLYMKNQMWSPTFSNFKPRMDFPLIRKGTYENDDYKFNGKAAIVFYPEAANYYYKVLSTMFDNNNKKAAIIYVEGYIHVLDKREIKRNFRNSTRRPSIKKKDRR